MPDVEALWRLTRTLKDAGWEFKSSSVNPTQIPAWAKIGQWVYCNASDQYAVIEDVIENETLGWIAVRVLNWRSTRVDDVIQPGTFLKHWQPCKPPKEPLTSWERLLGDDPW